MMDVRFQPMTNRSPWNADKWGKYLHRSPFKGKTQMDDLERELAALEATDIVIESGHSRQQIRNDGWPRGGSAPEHPDVRLYFKCKHGSLMYECKIFDSWEANLRAIGLWLQQTRIAIEERGIGTGGEAYRGFAALPAGASSIAAAEWASVEDAAKWLYFNFWPGMPSPAAVRAVVSGDDALLRVWYQTAARKAHPDAGGSNELMAKVNRARDFIEKNGGPK